MKFAKNFMMYAMAAVVAVAMTACGMPTPTPEPNPGGNNGNVTFTVTATAGETTATINVSHDGTAENTWFGFLTTDTKKADLSLIYEVVGNVTAEQLMTGATATINLTDLELATEYKYVVFGLKADGSMYGTAGSAVFTTEDGRSFTENSAWTIEYIGNYTPEGSEKTYLNCVNVTSTDNNTYYVDYFTPEQWESVKTDMYGYVESLVAQMKAYLGQINAQLEAAGYPAYTFEEAFLSSGGIASLGELDPGQYIAVAWGVTADEKVSRLYAKSAPFEVVEEEATPAYAAWIGNWTVTGPGSTWSEEAKNYVAGEVSFDITITKNVNNKSFLVDGWNGITGLPFVAAYDAEYDAFDIEGQILAENVEFSDGSIASQIILGGIMGNSVYLEALAYAIHTEDGSVVVAPYKYDIGAAEPFSFPEIIHFVAYEGEQGLYYFADTISGTSMAMTPAAVPAEVMGKNLGMFQGKKINTKVETTPYEFYKPGSDKFTSFSLK